MPRTARHPSLAVEATLSLSLLIGLACTAVDHEPENAPIGPWAAVPFTEVELLDDFWAPRMAINRDVTIPHLFEQNRITGRVANFERAAGRVDGPYEGRRFNDTDIYKALEAASYALNREHDPKLEEAVDELIELIAAAQQPDGYLFPALTVDPENPTKGAGTRRWQHVAAGSHELYNAGHLIEAAVAHARATGKSTLLDVAVRFADRIDEDFGPDALHDIPGHEEIELALVKLADLTGEQRYVDLARFFLDRRGAPDDARDGEPYPEDTDFAIYNDRPYKQDHLPVRDQRDASGHAVRATYLYTGMADVAARRTDAAADYDPALAAIWNDIVRSKMYLTGAIGSRGTFESFGEDYELPNATAYGESCASIGHEMWNHRMFLRSGDPRALDVMERVLYNALLAGISLEGDRFFYTNVLASERGREREAYFEVACCPANLSRTLAQLPGMVYATRKSQIFVSLYVDSRARLDLSDGAVLIEQRTDYPWDGRVTIDLAALESNTLEHPVDLFLRLPGWSRDEAVPSDLYRYLEPGAEPGAAEVLAGDAEVARVQAPTLDGKALGEPVLRIRSALAVPLRIRLELPMPVRRVRSHEAIEGNRDLVAIQRGPLVYAVEAADNGGSIDQAVVGPSTELRAVHQPDLLGGVTTVEAVDNDGSTRFTAVPYFAWANRTRGAMAVWLPTSSH